MKAPSRFSRGCFLSCNPEGDGQVQADSDAKYQPFLMSILPGFGCPDKVLVFLVQWIGKVYVKQVGSSALLTLLGNFVEMSRQEEHDPFIWEQKERKRHERRASASSSR